MNVNITENKNTVTVSQDQPTVVTVVSQGTQGASFSSTNVSMDDSGKVANSIPYYDAVAGIWKADSTTTKLTLVDGANF